MEITKVQNWQGGYKVNDQFFVAIDESNLDYQEVLTYINSGGIVDSEFTENELILKSKNQLVNSLEEYYFNSEELRILTINGSTKLSLSKEGRALVYEQISNLKNEIELGLKTEENAIFNYYEGDIVTPITLTQLKYMYVTIMNIVNGNFVVYQNHKALINNLQSVNESYDYTSGFTKNSSISI